MKLYTIYENGALRKVVKVDFSNHKVFLIDDDHHRVYLWIGKNASSTKRGLAEKRAKKYVKKRAQKSQLETLNQGKEYGRFLTILNALKQEHSEGFELEKREELKIKIDDTLELIEAGIEPDFEAEITIEAHKLSEEKKRYDELCQILAKLQIELLDGNKTITSEKLKEKAEEIRQSSSTYKELCWLIAELRLLKQKRLQT